MTDPACPVCSGVLSPCYSHDFQRGFSHTCESCRTLVTREAYDELARTAPGRELRAAAERAATAIVDQVSAHPMIYAGWFVAAWVALAICAFVSLVMEITS